MCNLINTHTHTAVQSSCEKKQCLIVLIAFTVQFLQDTLFFLIFFSFFNFTYSRWTSSLPSCLWSQWIFPSLPGSRLTIFYRDASSALLQLVNQWLNFTYSRSHAFRYERNITNNPTLVRIELTTSALASVQVTYWTTRATRAAEQEAQRRGLPPLLPTLSFSGVSSTSTVVASV